MAYFPLFIELAQKKALVVGAGPVGSRRIKALADFGARVTVVAVKPDQKTEQLAKKGLIRLLCGSYESCRGSLWNQSGQSSPFFLVLAATGDRQTDEAVIADGRAAGAFVNCAGDKGLSDFYFPGLAREGSVTAGVIASGTDHHLAKAAAERIRNAIRTETQEKQKGN